MAVYDRFHRPVVRGIDTGSESRTHQEFLEECNINRIMARFSKTGVFPPGVGVGRYGDFSEVGDYQQALATIEVAQAQFAGLPSKVRDAFKNDPGAFLNWIRSPEFSLDKAEEYGILKEEVVAARAAARAAAAAPAAPAPVAPVVVETLKTS